MTDSGSPYITTRIELEDTASDFSCGKHPLDDYFKRHALRNHLAGISSAYVLRRASPEVLASGTPMGRVGAPRPARSPRVLGFYTLSMASVESAQVAAALAAKLPRYPVPVALIGRLAVDEREKGQRLGEALLIDALRRVVDAAGIVGCVGVIVDAKDEDAEHFYMKYDFITITDDRWPRRMFLPLETARTAFSDP
jgi:GNAT superfamily N-acetyltransferase